MTRKKVKKNKAVYTATPVAGGWAVAVMSWVGAACEAGAVMIGAGAVKAVRTLKTKVRPTN